MNIKKAFEEENIFRFFEISLIIKGLFAVAEILSGIAVYFVSHETILYYVNLFAQSEFIEHGKDFIAQYLLNWAENFSVSAKNFTSFYLVSHGVVKLWLIIGLLKRRLWYYPTAIIIFGLFIAYQIYRFTFTHSIMLVFITILDLIVIGLTWHEYRFLSSHQKE